MRMRNFTGKSKQTQVVYKNEDIKSLKTQNMLTTF